MYFSLDEPKLSAARLIFIFYCSVRKKKLYSITRRELKKVRPFCFGAAAAAADEDR